MKKSILIFYILLFTTLFWNCQGNIDLISDSYTASLHGRWVYKEYVSGWNDTIVTIYNFMPNNSFEVFEFEVFQTHLAETLNFGGSYSLPITNLMFNSLEYLRRGDSIYTIPASRDTIIFQINDNDLFLCLHARSYRQLTGQPNTLSNSKFYDAMKLGTKYNHDIYHFTSDTLYRISTSTETSNFPQVWHNFNKYSYSKTDRYLDIEIGGNITRYGYIFYRGDFIKAWSPRKYKRFLK